MTDGPATDGPATGSPRSDRRRSLRRTAHAIGYGLIALVMLLVSGVAPFQTIRVPSDSMTPTVAPGDHLLLDKRHPDDVTVGDVVVVHDPQGEETGGLLVKRVVAVGGDAIGFEDGILVRNGVAVTEPYTTDFLDGVYYGPDVVPPGMLYLLGDNRLDSVDSRNFGPVPVSTVVGRIDARLFPSPGPLPDHV